MRQRVDAWLRHAQAVFWQPRCALCGFKARTSDGGLCGECIGDLPRNSLACASCAEPLTGDIGNAAHHRLRCGACLRRPPHFDAAWCPFVYGYPLDHLVRSLKYSGRVAYGRLLGQLFVREMRSRQPVPLPQLLIPVPLGYRRFRQRGYNQAIELGSSIERHLQIPLRADILERKRETAEQAGLTKRARRRNIKGAFAMLRPSPAGRVAIVDDVVTTGSTVNEMARVLKRAGVRHVEVWAIARAAHAGLNTNSSAMPMNTAMPK